jgi:hypothetical protein
VSGDKVEGEDYGYEAMNDTFAHYNESDFETGGFRWGAEEVVGGCPGEEYEEEEETGVNILVAMLMTALIS